MKIKILLMFLTFALIFPIIACEVADESDPVNEPDPIAENEHSFTPSPGDHWLAIDLPDIDGAKKLENCKIVMQDSEKYYKEQLNEAKLLSDKLEKYILDWYYKGADSIIPKGLLPSSIDNAKTHSWKLLRPEEVNPEEQWYYYPAREEPALNNFSKLYMNNAATHVTYLKIIFIAPFGSQLMVDGDFPHARFMDYQITEPFNPGFPVAANVGVMEVPIVDIDIEPDVGHVNPYRIGSDRNAKRRHYHLTFDLTYGNPVTLNPVMQNKHFRAPGNNRVGGSFSSTGPWGDFVITPSFLWLRHYAPDKGSDGKMDPLAGVVLPKVFLKLKTSEIFWIQPDATLAIERQLHTAPGKYTTPSHPPKYLGSSLGWYKMFGHWLMFAEGRGIVESYKDPGNEAQIKQNIRNEYRCYFNQGNDAPPPGNFSLSATDLPYNNYMSRPLWLGENMVYVLTGKLPTTPKTRNGENIMQKTQARYWSICHTSSGTENEDGVSPHKIGYGCLMDDEIAVDENNNYIIVYSRPEDRPSNAKTEYGVTWQDFGPDASQGFILRWMNVYPDHYMEEYTPNDDNIPWEIGSWSQDAYDKSLVGRNSPGALGPYQPVIHYMSKERFELLGDSIDINTIPKWE